MTAMLISGNSDIVQTDLIFNKLNELVEKFILKSDTVELTKQTYRRVLKFFVDYVRDNNIVVLDEEVVKNFRDSLLAAKKSLSTIRLYLSVVKVFVKHLHNKGISPTNFAAEVKHIDNGVDEAHKRKALTLQEARKLLGSMSENGEKNYRDKVIVALLLGTGIRVGECCKVDLGDIHFDSGKIVLNVLGKARRNKCDFVILPRQIFKMILKYIAMRKNVSEREIEKFLRLNNNQRAKAKTFDVNEPVFQTTGNRNGGQRLSTQVISRMCRAALNGINLTDSCYCSHSLRHTNCTLGIQLLGRENIAEISQNARHKGGCQITERYLHDLDRLNNRVTQTVTDALFT